MAMSPQDAPRPLPAESFADVTRERLGGIDCERAVNRPSGAGEILRRFHTLREPPVYS